MATETAVKVARGSGSTTADVVNLTKPCNYVRVRNLHATQTLDVSVATARPGGTTPVATVAVAGADETIHVPAASARVVMRSPRSKRLVSLSIIASGAATLYEVEGSDVELTTTN